MFYKITNQIDKYSKGEESTNMIYVNIIYFD